MQSVCSLLFNNGPIKKIKKQLSLKVSCQTAYTLSTCPVYFVPLRSHKLEKTLVVFGSCKIFFRKYIFFGNVIFWKEKYFQVSWCVMKIFLENIFMCLGVFWKCYFPPPPTRNPPPHNKKTTKTPPPTPQQQQQQQQKSEIKGRK